MLLHRFAAFVLMLFTAATAASQPALWPDADYDPAIPTLKEVVGHAPGLRITWSHDARAYLEALEAAAPDRIRVEEFGRSWEGRPLVYAVISAPDNLARSEEVRAGMQALADPRSTGEGEAKQLIESLPAVTWLAYGVHGNEISSTDAALFTAYHLLASRNDPRVEKILSETVVVINPMQNPDGRDRFIHRFETALGLEASPDRRSAEHNEPWPSGRTNHYLFDLNRDWFIRTQPETRAHADLVREWLPVAFVDLHEMGSDSTYYFAPEAVPYNPHLAQDQRDSLQLFGRTNAHWFDRFGIDYFTREVYDAFYPGYGASWPAYFGSVAMTYEQASARGLTVQQYDGNVLPYRETVRNHFVTSMGTAQTVAENREKLLRDFYDYQVSAVREGRSESLRAYVIPMQRDRDAVERLGDLLAAQGARIGRATEDFSACGADFGAGSLVINLDQPAKRMLRTLLDRHVPMEDDFLAEQERRRGKNLGDEIYDVTAWSMPLLFNLDMTTCSSRVNAPTERVVAGELPERAVPGKAEVAYLIPWGERAAVRFLSRALRAGVAIKSSDKPFSNGGRRYPGGTLIIDVADNDASLHDHIARWVGETRAEVVAVNDSWVTDGPSFGSRKVQRMQAPKVAMAWDTPTSSYSAGNLRFVLERQFDYPVMPIRVEQLADAELTGIDVLILPDDRGSYLSALGDDAVANMRAWIERGGVLIAIDGATGLLTDPEVDLLASRSEYAVADGEEDAVADSDEDSEPRVPGTALTPEDYAAAIAPVEATPAGFGGAILRATTDPDHWLAAGVAPSLHVLARSSGSYTPLRLDEGVNVVSFAAAEELVASGQLWEESVRQLALKPLVMTSPMGKGHVIAFTQDPTVRAYQDGLNVLVANAVFRAAAHARPVPR